MSESHVDLTDCPDASVAATRMYQLLNSQGAFPFVEPLSVLYKGRTVTVDPCASFMSLVQLFWLVGQLEDTTRRYTALFEQATEAKLMKPNIKRHWQQSWRNREGV